MVQTRPPGSSDETLLPLPMGGKAVRPKRRGRLSKGHVIMAASGFVAFVLVFAALQDSEETFQTAKLPVAVADLEPGTRISTADVKYVDIPISEEIRSSVLFADEIERLVAEGNETIIPIEKGAPFLEAMLRPVAANDGLRSMSFPVDISTSNAGQVTVGDRVDVIAVGQVRLDREEDVRGVEGEMPRQIDDVFAYYVVTDVEVLELRYEGDEGFLSGERFPPTLRVAVNDRQALELAAAMALDTSELKVVHSNGAATIVDFAPYRLRRELINEGL